jgi:hypothetical protein
VLNHWNGEATPTASAHIIHVFGCHFVWVITTDNINNNNNRKTKENGNQIQIKFFATNISGAGYDYNVDEW